MKTSYLKPGKAEWYVIDAEGLVLGRLATKVATVLRGRHRASWVPHWPAGDHVIVLNVEKIKITGDKLEQKTYYRHAGYLGHLRQKKLKDVMIENPAKAFEHAVKGMLPKNQTRQHTMKQLHVYAGPAHEYDARKPAPFPL